ncbi:MAG: hypothetical protein AB7W47_12270 [Calditrichaceae bacterium]
MNKTLENILNDNHSGSLSLTKKMLDLFRDELKSSAMNATTADDTYKSLQNMAKLLIKRQPNMVLLRKTSNALLLYFKRSLNSDKPLAEVIESIQVKIEALDEELDKNVDTISQLGSKIIANFNKVMTISNSTMVRNILLTASRHKRKFDVFCMKSHPPDEGALLAEELTKQNIKTTLISDTGAGYFMPEMNLVLLGADRLYETGFVNKLGSLQLCLTAKYLNVPVYLAVETTKILIESERAIKITPQNPDEMHKSKNKDLDIMNVYFEKVPLNLVHKVICENGVFETSEFINWYLKE